jgi:hypothetical protein
MKVTGKEAKDIVFQEHEDFTQILSKIVGQRRWVTEYYSINKHKPTDTYYAIEYDLPSTESCGDPDDSLWGDSDEVGLHEVRKVERKVITWESVK